MHTKSLGVLIPISIASGIAAAIVGCASNTPDDTSGAGAGGTGMTVAGKGGTSAMGGSAGTGTGGTGGSGGVSASGGTGGSTGGTGGKGTAGSGGSSGGMGGNAAGGAGGATGGMGGKAMAGGGGMSGGMGGAPMGGMGGMAGSGPPSGGSTGAGAGGSAGSGAFTLTSPDQAEGMKFDGKFTCNGGNLGSGINPELDWSGVPAGTKSFAITFIDTTIGDQDPKGQHWAAWNIPWDGTKASKFPQGTGATLSGDLMGGKQSGKFLAPCAQSLVGGKDDEYEFTIFALSTDTLAITGTTVANALTALKAVTPLAKATLHGHAGLKGQ